MLVKELNANNTRRGSSSSNRSVQLVLQSTKIDMVCCRTSHFGAAAAVEVAAAAAFVVEAQRVGGVDRGIRRGGLRIGGDIESDGEGVRRGRPSSRHRD